MMVDFGFWIFGWMGMNESRIEIRGPGGEIL
jgi:hypothetical protein